MKTPFLQPYQPMSREDEAELIRRGQSGDVQARNAVIMSTSILAWNIALKWNRRVSTLAEESYMVAMTMLTEKFGQFDLGMGVRFSTWATSWINNAMHTARHFRRETICKFPRYTRGMNEETQRKAAAASSGRFFSSWGETDWEKLEPVKDDAMVNPAKRLEESDVQQFVQEVLSKLHDRDSEVLLLRAQGLTLSDVGARLKITRKRVRQLEQRAQQRFSNVASLVNEPLYLEMEQEVCWSNRSAGVLSKPKRDYALEAKMRKTKTALIQKAIAELGDDFPKVREHLAKDGITITDSHYYYAKHGNGAGKKSKEKAAVQPAVGDLESLKKIKEYAKEHGGLLMIKNQAEAARDFLVFAEGFGGVDRLLEQVAFLQELAA